ncbi:MAG TPA: YIP1 family protein [Candidatus Eisenbacteria bacterium]|nr:YIP1 family protein [Candidatus Eisenbacteria bacterium]
MAIIPSVPAPESQQASISPVGRIFGVLFSPKATFEDIVRKPSWVLPVAVLALLGLMVAIAMNHRVNWRENVSQQIEKSPQASQLSDEQKEKQIEAGAKIAPVIVYVFGVPAPIILILVVALILWGAYSLFAGVNPGYKTAVAIVSHAYVPAMIANVLFVIILLLKDPSTLDLQNPVATNVAAFFPEDMPKWLDALGKNLDVFTVWILLLMAVGFAAVNPKKLKGGKSYGIAFGMFAFYLLVRVTMAYAFS